jgi:hypothetical protein
LRIKFLNPYNPNYDAISLVCDFEGKVEFALLKDFNLAGTMKEVKLGVESMKAYFLTEVELPEIANKVEALAKPLTKLINGFLSTGYGLPIPGPIAGELTMTRVFNYDHFLMIESDPQIENRVSKLADEAKENMEKFISKKLANDLKEGSHKH